MEFLSLVNTSLELNTNALALVQEPQVKEVENNFVEFERKLSEADETSALVEELNRVNAENKRLSEMLTVLCENYNSLRNKLKDYMSRNQKISGKRSKAESTNITNNNIGNKMNNFGSNNSDQSSSLSDEDSSNIFKKAKLEEEHVKAKISRISVRTELSDNSLIVKDGYQWRKYGQKVTRDNPCPRGYFKCSFAPSCPVKKKVQRSREDQSIVVATYEGEHNHPNPSKPAEPTSSTSAPSLTLGSAHHLCSSGPTTTSLGLSKPDKPKNNNNNNTTSDARPTSHAMSSPGFQQFLVEQMASTLTEDPTFKAALAAAVSGRFIQHN